jgi:hypothetical protein
MNAHDEIPSVSSGKEALKLVLSWHTAAADEAGRPLAAICTKEFKEKNGPAFLNNWTEEKWEASKHTLKRVAECHCMTAVGLSRLLEPTAKKVSLDAYQTAGKFVRQFCPPNRAKSERGLFVPIPQRLRGDWCTWP